MLRETGVGWQGSVASTIPPPPFIHLRKNSGGNVLVTYLDLDILTLV